MTAAELDQLGTEMQELAKVAPRTRTPGRRTNRRSTRRSARSSRLDRIRDAIRDRVKSKSV